MKPWIRLVIATACALLLSATVAVPPACGAPVEICEVHGVFDTINPPSGMGVMMFTLSGGVVTSSSPGALPGASTSDLSVSVPSVSATFTITTPDMESAVFSLASPPQIDLAMDNTLIDLITSATLISDSSPTFDFSCLADATLMVMFPPGIKEDPGMGKFTYDFSAGFPGAEFWLTSNVIPEPGSLPVWALVGLAGVAWLGRRRRPAAPGPGR